jgi:alpha-L-fucosidase
MKSPRKKFAPAAALVMLTALLITAAPNPRLPAKEWNSDSWYTEKTPDADYQHASSKAYEDFQDMKFGIRVHWGIYTLAGSWDASWPFQEMNNAKRQAYQELYQSFNPVGFDAEEWMKIFERAGAKCFAITTKHHEGFSLFDTKTRVHQRANWTAPGGPKIEDCDLAYSVMDTPFKRDIIKELADAAHKHAMKIDLYFSHPDWYDADFRPYCYHPLQTAGYFLHPWDYGWVMTRGRITLTPPPTREETARAMARHRQQLIELLSNYGKIDMVCLDMMLGPAVWPEMKETIKELRKIQPDVMFRNRGIGNYGDYYTPEGFVPGDPANTDMPWMVIYPLGRSFSYEPLVEKHKGARWIIHNLIDSVAKGGNFMVGIGPDANGQFHPEAIKELAETGDWLQTNGEAIYATRMCAQWREGRNVRFTRGKDGKYVYAILLEWPGKQLSSIFLRPRPGSSVRMLGVDQDIAWQRKGDATVIEIPESVNANPPGQHAWTIRIEPDRAAP